MDGTVIVCGLGTVGVQVVRFLRTTGCSITAIDLHADPNDPRFVGIRVIRGDFRRRETLEAAGIAEAAGVMILTSDDLENVATVMAIRGLNPKVRIVLRLFNQNLAARLGNIVSHVTALSVSALAAPLLAQAAVTGDVLTAVSLPDGPRQLTDALITTDSRKAGMPISSLLTNEKLLILGHFPVGDKPQLLLDMEPATKLEVGDRVVLCGKPDEVRKFLHPTWEKRLEVLWAGKLRRYGRLLWRAFVEIDLAVKICTATLIFVVLFSTGIYHYGLHYSWPDSLYQTISVIATGADLGGREYQGWGKVFVSFLKLMGTALVAAFTAIVTNYLLRARLGGIFEFRRVPDRGHIVVCGLGNVGFRVVEELLRMGEQVVVLENDPANSFIPSCRKRGVAVVVGDSSVAEVLMQARVKTAKAVIAATSGDLVNLEIALLVTEFNPHQRIVVRLQESSLAEPLRQIAGVRMALSVAELAAPALVAGLLGDRVQGMVKIADQMITILDLVITEQDTRFLHDSLRVLAIDHRIVPVAITDRHGQSRPLDSRTKPEVGDRITLIALLEDVERLVRREAIPRGHSVEVQSYPLPSRDELVLQVSAYRKLPIEEAEKMVLNPPFILAEEVTFGQAEELVANLERQRVVARMVVMPK